MTAYNDLKNCPKCEEKEVIENPGYEDIGEGMFWCQYCGHTFDD